MGDFSGVKPDRLEEGDLRLIESVNGRLIIGIDDVLTKVKEELL